MHMSDSLLSPMVGGAFLAITGCTMAYSCKKNKRRFRRK